MRHPAEIIQRKRDGGALSREEIQRIADVRARCVGDPGGDAGASLGLGVGGLPDDAGQVRREVCGVLTESAGDLEDHTVAGQHLAQHLEDRHAVSRGRRMGLLRHA